MKKEFLFLLFLLMTLANKPALAQKDVNGCVISSRINENQIIENIKQANISKITAEYDTVRPLTEINRSHYADAYPWISPDGLRLYYTKEIKSGDEKIFYAERKNILDTFSNFQELSINFSDYDNVSPWLTNDELDIYFIINESSGIKYRSLYHAKRNSINDKFSEAKFVQLKGPFSGYIGGPSLTQDKFQLFLYLKNKILIFNRINEDEYNLVNTLIIPECYKVGPGQLTKDDLKYYFSLDSSWNSGSIYYSERKTIADNFDSLYYLDNNLINGNNFDNFHPTLSENKNILVFVRSIENWWSECDLYIAYNTVSSVQENNSLINNSVSAFPNPFSNQTKIKFNLIKPAFVKIDLYNYLGILVKNIKQEFIEAGEYEEIITADGLSSGFYYLTIQVGESLITEKLIIIK